MIRVSDILPEAKKIVGHYDNAVVFRKITDAVELLANKGDFDPLVGTVDICTSGRVVTLPSEVEVILAVNMVGEPAVGRDELYHFHINGPGSIGPAVRYQWTDMSDAPVFRDPPCPSRLYVITEVPEDAGLEFVVYGYDSSGNYVRTRLPDGTYKDGWRVPVFYGVVGTVPATEPKFERISAVQKAPSRGPVRLIGIGDSGEELLAVYQSYDTIPRFKRILLSDCVPWVRIKYRRRTFAVRSEYDLLPLHSSQALLAMLRAIRAYEVGDIPQGEAYEATAVRWLTEEQRTRNAPVVHPIQVFDGAGLLEVAEEIH